MNEVVLVRIHGKWDGEYFASKGLPLRGPHFAVTYSWVDKDNNPTLEDIEFSPALTHLPSGLAVGRCFESVEQARWVAAALEGLPIPWDATPGEIQAAARELPPALRSWLKFKVCDHRNSPPMTSPGQSAQSVDVEK